MRQYTSPTHTVRVKGIDITGADKVYVTYANSIRNRSFTVEDPPAVLTEGNTDLAIDLTQEQTGIFGPGESVDIEVNWMIGGKRYATGIKRLAVAENLIPEVIANE